MTTISLRVTSETMGCSMHLAVRLQRCFAVLAPSPKVGPLRKVQRELYSPWCCAPPRLQKHDALRAVLRPRRRLNLCCAVDCAGSGLGPMPALVRISHHPPRVSHFPHCSFTHATTRGAAGRCIPSRLSQGKKKARTVVTYNMICFRKVRNLNRLQSIPSPHSSVLASDIVPYFLVKSASYHRSFGLD